MCITQWVLGEKNIKQSCCRECEMFMECLRINRIKRWEILHDLKYKADFYTT